MKNDARGDSPPKARIFLTAGAFAWARVVFKAKPKTSFLRKVFECAAQKVFEKPEGLELGVAKPKTTFDQ